ncbi:pilus assembly protein N-terminal domain-containing protein [Methylobacterium marchantiae]|uniref:Pilus assembly protein N-terminal domain-containing protein n=2 Tax=Methylobacterium marchantiae TaxID=600331 RepID=A0ABW3WVU1_9HYPH|nr:hypothetical protein AIGOOFII_0530 [Methylobacterium marchantiae]
MPTITPWKRLARSIGVSLCFVLGASSAFAETAPAIVAVNVDNAKVIRLPERTQTVIVGNPLVADVALQKNGIVILTGKSFGSTNLIALDASGGMLAESTISVQAAQGAIVTVQRGLDRESYSCTPNCMPSMQLGDATKYFGDVSGQADSRRTLATAGSGPR